MSIRRVPVHCLLALNALVAGIAFAQDPATAPDAAAETAAVETVPAPAAAPEPLPLDPADSLLVGDAKAGGAKAAACGACHGADGNSAIEMYPKLAGQNEAYIARQLALYKTMHRQDPIMLGFASSLGPQDMHDVGAYFASKAVMPGVADEALVARGQAIYRGGDTATGVPPCMACHGPDGRGMAGTGYPQLAGQWTSYVATKLTDWKNGKTWGNDLNAQIMPAIAQRMSDADITAVASYIEGLHTATSGTRTASQ